MDNEEWSYVPAQDFCLKVTDGTHDSPKRKEEGKYLITSKHIKERSIDYSSAYLISEEEYEKINQRSRVDQWDVLISMIGEYCGFCYIEREKQINYAVKNVGIFKAGTKIKAEWIYYYLNSMEGKNLLSALKRGTSQPYLSLGSLRNLPIRIYKDDGYMHNIVLTLSCLDDKIELNNRINKVLEEMARAIFKSWFVDFEPFQDREFEDSELGKIPKGWKAGTISDLGEITGGSTPSKAKNEYFSNNGIAWITPKDLSINKNKFISKGEIGITELGLKNSSTKIMPKGTVLFSSRAPIGYIAIAKNELTTNQGFKSVVPKKNIGTAYIYYYLKSNVKLIESRASGSTFKEVSGSIMKSIPALIPDDNILIDFNKICYQCFEKQMLLENENMILTNIRDSLLPKLMSGEIRVPVEEVQ